MQLFAEQEAHSLSVYPRFGVTLSTDRCKQPLTRIYRYIETPGSEVGVRAGTGWYMCEVERARGRLSSLMAVLGDPARLLDHLAEAADIATGLQVHAEGALHLAPAVVDG